MLSIKPKGKRRNLIPFINENYDYGKIPAFLVRIIKFFELF
jgi:hypothetical protein